jgi:hypothetical protein
VGSTLVSTGAWDDCAAAIGADQAAAVSDASCAVSGNWVVVATRADSEFTVTPLDPDAYEAIPEAWRDMIGANFSVLARKTTNTNQTGVRSVSFADSETCGSVSPNFGFWHKSSGDYLKFDSTGTTVVECVLLGNETITAPPIGQFVVSAGRNSAGENCFSGALNTLVYEPIVGETFFITIPVMSPA